MQKTTFPVQILIHDDCSTDGTDEIVKYYELKYPKLIKAYYQPENSYSKPDKFERRKEFGLWRIGKYEAICEGDDYWIDPLKLQKQVDFLEVNPEYSMCFHNAFILESSAHGRTVFLFNDFTSNCDLTINDIICKWVAPTASLMFRKENWDYPNWMALIYSGDYSLLLYMFTKGKIKYIDTISSVYRKILNGSSVSVTTNSNFVRKQHILLLESFNDGTNKKYDNVITKRIKTLKKEIALREAIWQHKYYKLIFMLPHIWQNRNRLIKA